MIFRIPSSSECSHGESFWPKSFTIKLTKDTKRDIPLGYLDATFHRDDFRRREIPARANETKVPFIIEGKKVVLVDDVLFTGRSIRAAMDAMIAFGRPATVELVGAHRSKKNSRTSNRRRLCWKGGKYIGITAGIGGIRSPRS